jgi:hypothetical protein
MEQPSRASLILRLQDASDMAAWEEFLSSTRRQSIEWQSREDCSQRTQKTWFKKFLHPLLALFLNG